jgi:predicted transcriptional regulator
MSDSALDQESLITLASDIVSAHVSNNTVVSAELPGLIANVYNALAGLGDQAVQVVERPAAAVSVRASVKPDYIVCLEDGKKMKMLKRHLMTDHGMTPAQYRERWNLPGDYPMVSVNYSEKRRDLAKQIGLGRKPGAKVTRRKKATAASVAS